MYQLYYETTKGERWYYRRDDGSVWKGDAEQTDRLWRALLTQQQILTVEEITE